MIMRGVLMSVVFYILGIVLCILFFLNIDNAAQLLCKIAGSFAALFLYNAVSSYLSLPAVGVNFITALTCAVLNLPGGILLLLLSAIF